jgi:hypothetical protein
LCRASEIVGFGEETGKIVLLVDDAATGAGGFALTERFACGWDRSDVMYWAAPLGAVKSVESSGPFFTLNG